MQADTIKLWISYLMAAAVIAGGAAMLFVSRNEGNTDFQLVIAGFIGAAISFLFNGEAGNAARRTYERGLNTTVVAPDDGG